MAQVLINKFIVNALYYARVTEEGRVEFMNPATMDDLDQQPEGWPYLVTQGGGQSRLVMVEYNDNRLIMPFVTPSEAVLAFHNGIRALADTAASVEKNV